MTRKKRITLKDIAKEFNVSIATVSKALNDSHEISIKTKARIREYAEKNKYTPNILALNLQNKQTKNIGVIIPNMLNNFFTKVFVGIEEVATESGYNLITCISNESYEKEVNIMELLKNAPLDGFLLSIAEETQIKENYSHFINSINQGIPIVMFDRVTDKIDCNKVIVNDEEGAYHATSHLIATGCKNIGLVATIHNISVGKLRIQGYKRALKDADIPYDPSLIITKKKYLDIETSIKILLGDKQEIDAFLCLEEDSAISVLKILKAKNYRIPEEISIIAFTNGSLLKNVSPSITTVSQHSSHMGRLAAKMLIEYLESTTDDDATAANAFKTKIVKTSLIERESTRELI